MLETIARTPSARRARTLRTRARTPAPVREKSTFCNAVPLGSTPPSDAGTAFPSPSSRATIAFTLGGPPSAGLTSPGLGSAGFASPAGAPSTPPPLASEGLDSTGLGCPASGSPGLAATGEPFSGPP
mgnify:CR=1 FL=1